MKELPGSGLLDDGRRAQEQSVMATRQWLACEHVRQEAVDRLLWHGLTEWLVFDQSTRIPTVPVAGARTFALSVMVQVTR